MADSWHEIRIDPIQIVLSGSSAGASFISMERSATSLAHRPQRCGFMVPAVFYHKIRSFNKGFYSSSWITADFKKCGFLHYLCRMADTRFEGALTSIQRNMSKILDFLNVFVCD